MLMNELVWRPTEEWLKGAFILNRMRGLHCFNHDGIMLPRENHKSQNPLGTWKLQIPEFSCGGGVTVNQDVIGWSNVPLLAPVKGRNAGICSLARLLWWRKPLDRRALGCCRWFGFSLLLLLRDVCRARLPPLGKLIAEQLVFLTKAS